MSEHIEKEMQATMERLKKQFGAMTPEQKQEAELERKKQQDEVRHDQIRYVRGGWNAPERQLRMTDLDTSGEWGEQQRKLSRILGTGFLIGLVGGRGPGKTQMGVELMKTTTTLLRSAYYNTLTGIFLEIKATFKSDAKETEQDLMNRLCKPSLLVVDEIGMRSDSDWENRMVFELIDRRYRLVKDTLLIANLSKDEFLKTIGDSLSSRMQETGGIVECNWQSYRL